MRFVHLSTTPSTNAEALKLAAAGEAGPLWVVADEQTGGKGRSGRGWVSVPGNLYATLLLRPRCEPAHLAELSLVAGVAVIEAIREVAGPTEIPGLRLKWPNDVLVGHAKLTGILVESIDAGGERGGRAAVIGIGINVAGHPADLGRATTDLTELGLTLSAREMLDHLALAMDTWLAIWDDGRGFAGIRRTWLDRAGPVGEPTTINTGRGTVTGRYVGIDAEGALLIEDETGGVSRFTYGDVTVGAGMGPAG